MWHMKHMKVSPFEKKKKISTLHVQKNSCKIFWYTPTAGSKWKASGLQNKLRSTSAPNLRSSSVLFDDGIRRGTSTRWAALRWTPFRRVRFCVCWWAFPWANLLYLPYRYEEPSADILWPSLLRRMLSRDIHVAWLFLSLTHLKYACKT